MAIRRDLWPRLSRLAQGCEILTISQFDQDQRVGWIVRIKPRGSDASPIQVEGATLAEALSEATLRAEAAGWG
jgi:hypothetical protein